MKKDYKIFKKAFECTTFTWGEIDFPFGNPDAWSSTVYAESAGQARRQFYMQNEYSNSRIFLRIKVRRKPDCDYVENIADPLAEKVTKEMYELALHAIGGEERASNPPYRNRYVVEHNEHFETLIELGLAGKRSAEALVGGNYYYLTSKGIEVIMSMRPILRTHRRNKDLLVSRYETVNR